VLCGAGFGKYFIVILSLQESNRYSAKTTPAPGGSPKPTTGGFGSFCLGSDLGTIARYSFVIRLFGVGAGSFSLLFDGTVKYYRVLLSYSLVGSFATKPDGSCFGFVRFSIYGSIATIRLWRLHSSGVGGGLLFL